MEFSEHYKKGEHNHRAGTSGEPTPAPILTGSPRVRVSVPRLLSRPENLNPLRVVIRWPPPQGEGGQNHNGRIFYKTTPPLFRARCQNSAILGGRPSHNARAHRGNSTPKNALFSRYFCPYWGQTWRISPIYRRAIVCAVCTCDTHPAARIIKARTKREKRPEIAPGVCTWNTPTNPERTPKKRAALFAR